MSVEWVIGIAAGIVCALVGVIYLAGQGRDDKQDVRFDRNEKDFSEHVKEDALMHERIVRVETKVEALETEVSKLREMRHDIMKHTTEALASWYASVVDIVGKRFAELVAMIERLKK